MKIGIEHTKAIFAASFDPFTKGHLEILTKATNIFDEICVLITTNSNKSRKYSSAEMARAIRETIFLNDLCHVIVNDQPNVAVADYALRFRYTYLIRGLRNPQDYQYEENIAKINKEINPNLETIYFRTDNEIISSSFVKEMLLYGKDISKYVSKPVHDLITKEKYLC